MPARDFWSFGRPDDDIPESPLTVPPGYRFARSIQKDAPYGKQLACRSCGALIAATDNAISRHKTFHERLVVATGQNNLGMNYAPENPNRVDVSAELVLVQMESVEKDPSPP